MQGRMKEKMLHFLVYMTSAILLTACRNEIDEIAVPVNRTAENLHTQADNIEIEELEIIPDTEVHVKESQVLIEKKFSTGK